MTGGKAALRRAVKAQIAALEPGYTPWASARILRALMEHPAYIRAQTIFCYVGRPDEVDTLPLLRAALAAGKTVAVPLCTGPGEMQARLLLCAEELRPTGPFGILEPPRLSPVVPPPALDLCVLPCLAAAPDGVRLGYGGGYYDRFLPRAPRAVRAVLCRERVMRPRLPREAHDVPADVVFTETAVYAPGI